MALFGRSNGHGNGNPAPTTVVAAPTTMPPAGGEPPRSAEAARYELKTRVHRQLIERLDLTKLNLLPLESVGGLLVLTRSHPADLLPPATADDRRRVTIAAAAMFASYFVPLVLPLALA